MKCTWKSNLRMTEKKENVKKEGECKEQRKKEERMRYKNRRDLY